MSEHEIGKDVRLGVGAEDVGETVVREGGGLTQLTPEEWIISETVNKLAVIRTEYKRMIRLIWASIAIMAVLMAMCIGLALVTQRQNSEPIAELLRQQRQSLSPASKAASEKNIARIINAVDCANKANLVNSGLADQKLLAPCLP